MSRIVLDAGALMAFERGDPKLRLHLAAAEQLGLEAATTSPVVSQVWRDGRRQALLVRLLRSVRVDAPDEATARRAGELLAQTRTSDVVDALLVGLARDGDTILTSDPDDIARLLAAAGVDAIVVTI